MERARILERIKKIGLADKVAAYCDGYRVDRLLIENKANGFAMDSELRRQFPDASWLVELIDPEGKDKSARAESCVPAFAAGLVWAPGSPETGTFREWAEAAIEELADLFRVLMRENSDPVILAKDFLGNLRTMEPVRMVTFVRGRWLNFDFS